MWHLTKYQAGEIIDLAVEIEKTGGKFYRKLAEKAPSEQIKGLLLYLASEEDQHQVRFSELGKDLEAVNVSETYQGEYFEYVGFTVEQHLFNNADKLEQLVENARTGLDIIKLAIDFERDTVLFFYGFRNVVLKDQQSVVDDLIMEEQIHLVKLSRLRKEIVQNVK